MPSLRNHLKSIGALLTLTLISSFAFNLLPYVHAVDSAVYILPAPPVNAVAINSSPTEVTLTWDASPNNPSSVASYTVFYKQLTDPGYPASPQITRTDSLVSYSEVIPVLAGVTYNFIIYTNSTGGYSSTDDCASCKATNTVLCGNGLIDAGEECDGINLDGALCTDFGHELGSLSCTSACAYNYSNCYTPSGGGGGEPQDTIPPSPGIAVSPAYANSSPITVTYSGATDTGGSGLASVTLLYKKGTGTWKNTNLSSSGSSGSFSFLPESDLNATYYFDLLAYDNAGNVSEYVTGSGDTSTVYDTQLPAITKVTLPSATRVLPMVVSYEGAADVGIAGLKNVELWYKKGSDGAWINSGLTSSGATGSFSFSPTEGSANYYFDLIAVDEAENRSTETSETLTAVMYDAAPPTYSSISVTAPGTGSIVVNYSGAVDVGPAGLRHVELWYKKDATGTWTDSTQRSSDANGTFTFLPSAPTGTYYFMLVLEDKLGNRTEPASGDGSASIIYTAKPFAAVLSNLPAAITEVKTADIIVGGENIVTYKHKLNESAYSSETPIATHITLTALADGTYNLSVVGKNSVGLWQDVSSPTTYTWQVITPTPPAPVVAVLSDLPPLSTELTNASITVGGTDVVAYKFKLDSGIYGIETLTADKINLSNLAAGAHTLSVIGKNSLGTWQSESTPTTYSWEVVPVPAIPVDPLHCENEIIDADEMNIDCGGRDCPICIDVTLSVLARPMGRSANVYQSAGFVNLYSARTGKLVRSEAISLSNGGGGQAYITQIPASTYDVGLKSNNYLRKIIDSVALEEDKAITTLDFTLGGIYYLIGGDVFNDNIVNSFDLALMLKNYMAANDAIDMNRDGLANAADLAMILRNYRLIGDSI